MPNLSQDEIISKQQEISILQSVLSAHNSDIGDWKVAKCQEYLMCGLESPYDIEELHSKRQNIRDQINELQKELEETEEETPAE